MSIFHVQAMHVFSFEVHVFRSLAYFLVELFGVLLLNCLSANLGKISQMQEDFIH